MLQYSRHILLSVTIHSFSVSGHSKLKQRWRYNINSGWANSLSKGQTLGLLKNSCISTASITGFLEQNIKNQLLPKSHIDSIVLLNFFIFFDISSCRNKTNIIWLHPNTWEHPRIYTDTDCLFWFVFLCSILSPRSSHTSFPSAIAVIFFSHTLIDIKFFCI